MNSIKIVVSGRVQGVGFRYFTVQQAINFSIKGYVKNTADGNVKIIAIAESNNLDEFIKAIKQGPRFSWVEKVDISPLQSTRKYEKFRIEY